MQTIADVNANLKNPAPNSGLLSDSAAYASQTLRTKTIATTTTSRSAGIEPQDPNAAARSLAVFNQGVSASDPLLRIPGANSATVDSNQTGPTDSESTMILSARGTFFQVKLSSSYGPGVYAIDELTREAVAPDLTGPQATSNPNAALSPILLTSVEFNQNDITSQVPCLDNVKVFYSFGQNFGQVVISGEVLLGPLGDINYDGVNRVIDFFWKNRVSEKRTAIAVSVANNSYYVYLTGMRISRVDPDFHIMPFMFFGTLLDISREKSARVNLAGTVITGGSLDEPSLFKAMTSPPVTRPASNPHDEAAEDFNNQVSLTNDPALNQTGNTTAPTPPNTPAANVGPAGNTTAARTMDMLTNQPKTQADKDIDALQAGLDAKKKAFRDSDPSKGMGFGAASTERTDAAAYDREIANYQAAIRGAQAARAQEANLAAGGKVQEIPLQQQQDALIYQRMAAELRVNQAATSTPGKTEL